MCQVYRIQLASFRLVFTHLCAGKTNVASIGARRRMFDRGSIHWQVMLAVLVRSVERVGLTLGHGQERCV